MPSAAWIAASKKTPMQPVFYAACESVDAINVEQKLASDWNAGVIDNLDVFNIPGGGAGLRPKLYTYNQAQVTWANWFELVEEDGMLTALFSSQGPPNGGQTPWFTAPVPGFLESVTARWRVRYYTAGDNDVNIICGWPASIFNHYNNNLPGALTINPQVANMLRLGQFAQGASVPVVTTAPDFHDTTFGAHVAPRETRNIYPYQDANFIYNYRAKTGTITTKVFDLGTVPNVNSRVLIEDMVTGASSISYICEGSATGTGGWVSLGAVADGREVAPYRYYRFQITMVSTGYDTPELYSIRVVGGNQQSVYLGTHRGEPALPSGEVQPYLLKVSSISSKISLKDKPTVGDLTLDLAWMPLTSDLVQSTGKRRSVTVYLGFAGLPLADYEPYFTGMWESYTADQEKRTFTVKLRDVWKKFKKKIPEQQNNGGVRVDIYHQFGQSPSGSGTALNIVDAIVQVADMAKAPDRYIDRAGLAALKAAHYSGTEWNVFRVLTDQKESDDLLKELAVSAGLFLVPATDGKLTPYHYDTIAATVPAVTLDAAQIRFTQLTPDMAETVTRHNIFFNLIEDSQGRRSGGSPDDYSHVYTTVGSNNSVVAERDREEVITGEWFDNWGLAAGAANGVPNPLTKLADRFESWYTPIATVNGKQVATTKVSVRAENVPLRYYADVMPGKTVYVDNLRLPCPANQWGGFSDQVKFLVLGWNVDTKNYTLTLDLFQIAPLSYNQSPTWSIYDRRDLFPPVTALTLGDALIPGADGIARPGISVSFVPPAGYTEGAYEVWISEGGGANRLYASIPAANAGSSVSIVVPAQTGVNYQVSVITITTGGNRPAPQDAPSGSLTAGAVAEITKTTLQLLNPSITYDAAEKFLNGTLDMISLLDTDKVLEDALIGQKAFLPGVVLPGVQLETITDVSGIANQISLTRIYQDTTNANILIQAGRTDVLTGRVSSAEIAIDGANAAIQLRATKDELQGEVDVLSDLIGLKLDAGPISAGLVISWTDETHTKSNITAYSDTFKIMQPNGTGARTVFAVGNIGGTPAVGVDGNIFIDGSILARSIAADQLVVGDNVAMGPNATISWANVSGKPTIPTVPSYITSTKITATTIESPTISAGVFTGSEFTLGNGTTYGKIETYDFADRSVGIQIQDGATPSITLKGGTFTGSTLQTAATGRRFVVTSSANQAEFYGDRGDGAIMKMAAIGVDAFLGLHTAPVGSFGRSDTSIDGLAGVSGSGIGLLGLSSSGYGGWLGQDVPGSIYRQGLDGFAGASPCRLAPGNGVGAPTHNAYIGSLWVDQNGILYIQTAWRSGNTWQKVGAQ